MFSYVWIVWIQLQAFDYFVGSLFVAICLPLDICPQALSCWMWAKPSIKSDMTTYCINWLKPHVHCPHVIIFFIRLYLCNQTFRMSIDGIAFKPVLSLLGIPEWQIRGHIQHLLFTNDLPVYYVVVLCRWHYVPLQHTNPSVYEWTSTVSGEHITRLVFNNYLIKL